MSCYRAEVGGSSQVVPTIVPITSGPGTCSVSLPRCGAAMSRRMVLSLFLLAAFTVSTDAQTAAWLEVRTPHFVVVSNSGEKQARRATLQLERIRAVFRGVFPNANIDPATPIVVLAVEDKRTFEALEPEVYRANGQSNLAGLFLHASEKNYVLVWLNAPFQHPYAPIYHEYAHFVLNRTGEWIPLWLNEGWAEFYQNTEILDREVRLGKLDAYTPVFLERNPLLPFSTLFTVDDQSPYYHEEDKSSMFYAESWALTHYLTMKDDREHTHRLLDYLDLVHKKVDTVTAAAQAFGDLSRLQSDLHKYIVDGDYGLLQVPVSSDVDDSSFAVRTLTETESDSVRADFLAYNHRENDALTLLQAVLGNDPADVSAHETMGFMAFRQGNYDEARQWCGQAIKLDAADFQAHYCFAISTMRKGLLDVASQSSIENSLRAAIRLNPSFTPAYNALGGLFAMHGKR